MQIIKTRKGQEIIVDDADYSLFKNMSWRVNPQGYAVCTTRTSEGRRTSVLLHRLIMQPKSGFVVDHINGNTSDNRRSNLRICTNSDNLTNSDVRVTNKIGYKGVYFHKATKRFTSQITKNGRKFYLGLFDTPEEAYEVYRKASKELHGEFSRV